MAVRGLLAWVDHPAGHLSVETDDEARPCPFAQPASAVLSWPVHVVSCHFTWGIVDEWNLMHIHSVKYGALIPIRGTTVLVIQEQHPGR